MTTTWNETGNDRLLASLALALSISRGHPFKNLPKPSA